MTLEPVSIDVDGQIDLIDLVDHDESNEHVRADSDRVRKSRLADVMIVMERERIVLEEALRARLAANALTNDLADLTLQLDENEPQFRVTIEPTIVADATVSKLLPDQREALETEIAAEVCALIEQRAVNSQTPRWQPRVTATYRTAAPAADAARQSRLKSVWLQILFWLLASLILATAYLFLKGMPT